MLPWSPVASARLLLAGVLVAGALAGCKATAESGELPDSPAEAITLSEPPAPTTYVAMGDSYTAAPLFPLDDALVIDSCLRSRANYPSLVASELGIDVRDVSCSGASTVSMFHGQKFTTKTRPPQLDALGPDVDLVTLGIGANDFRFFSRMIFTCLKAAEKDVQGSPCRLQNLTADGRDRLGLKLDKIRDNVERVVEAISERAPEAQVVLVGYPQLLPTEGTCRSRLPLAVGDYGYALELNLRLANAVREGGEAAGAQFVDLIEASQGHDICSEDPWVAGIRGKRFRAAGLHPYPAEQEAVAQLVLEQL